MSKLYIADTEATRQTARLNVDRLEREYGTPLPAKLDRQEWEQELQKIEATARREMLDEVLAILNERVLGDKSLARRMATLERIRTLRPKSSSQP